MSGQVSRPSAYGAIAVLSIVLAAASLRLPSALAYDPWAWTIWGREIVHLQLVTTGGPTWHPLPMLFTTLFAPFGRAAPQLWLVVARAGGIMAVLLAFTLAFRLTRGLTRRDPGSGLAPRDWRRPSVDAVPALIGGLVAAVGVLVLSQYINDVALGDSEGLLAALTLLAILRFLDHARRQAFVLGLFAALDRPEVWPFFGLYAIYLWRRDAGARRMILALIPLIPAAWFLPELWGSGSLVRGVTAANEDVRPGSAVFTHCPFCSEITQHGLKLVMTPFKIGALAVLAIAAVRVTVGVLRKRRGLRTAQLASGSEQVVLALGLLGAAWILEEAVLTQAGFSGNNRYLIAAACLIVIVGAVAWAGVLSWVARRLAAYTSPATGQLTALVLLVPALWVISPRHGPHLISLGPTKQALRYQAELRHDLPAAVQDAGGAQALLACGPVRTNTSQSPLAAWTLGVHLVTVNQSTANVIIQSRNAVNTPIEPIIPRGKRYRLVAHVRTVKIFTSC